MSEKSALTGEELKLLYQVTVSDLSYFKTQQWAVTNYCFLLLAGVAGVWQAVKGNVTTVERGALIGLAVAVAISTLIILHKLQASIQVRQSRLDATREHFSIAFYEAWSAETKPQEFVHAISFLRPAAVIGCVVVCWLVLRA